jgi:Domain of unknown function (DUF4386)
MNASRKTAIVVGALFLTAMVASIIGGALIEPLLTAPDGLVSLPANQTQLVSGVLLELINAVAVVGIAVMMFPILKKRTEALALGYVAIRVIEALMQIAADVIPLSLLTFSQGYLIAGTPDVAAFQAAGALWIAARTQLVGTMLGIFFGLGALLFYYALNRSRLVPRWLSIWGLAGAVPILAWNLSGMFGIDLSAGMILALPIILNEIVLGIWLILKGFQPSALAPGSAQKLQAELV